MKALILAGGFGSRLSEETDIRPKPMVEVGGKPILWHIMKMYSYYGINDFIILLGYKGYYIKEYFANYFLHQSDVTIDISNNNIKMHNNSSEPWKVTLLDTGLNTMTGARVKKAKPYVKDETFMLTYGDGLADIDINEALKFHKHHGKLMTMTSAKPDSRFGLLNVDTNNKILQFQEKPQDKDSRVNAGYFICQPEVFEYIDDGEDVVFEQEPIKNLVKDEQIYTYKHNGFWMPMDTLRDKIKLNELYKTQNAPWMVWKD